MAGQRLAQAEGHSSKEDWRIALDGFVLATRIQPELGRAWNNQGIALSRLGRFEEARVAYERALELDTAFGSAKRNLAIMKTRAQGKTTVTAAPISP